MTTDVPAAPARTPVSAPRPATPASAAPARSSAANRAKPTRKNQPNPMAAALAVVRRIAQSPLLDRPGWRPRAERAAYHATKTGLSTVAAVSRTFEAATRLTAPQRPSTRRSDLFDLTPTEDQQMILDVVKDFAAEQVRPAAADADTASATPDELVATAVELGMWQLSIPDTLGGLASERAATTGVLVAEHLAHGDLGIAVACLAPASVATAISLWGSAEQQSTYLPAFVADAPPRAAFAVVEPHALFDPFAVRTTARRVAGGYVLDGVKSLVPAAARCELFLVAAQVVDGAGPAGPALFVVESGTTGLSVEAEPAMGLRAAQTGRLTLASVTVPERARITTTTQADGCTVDPYREAVRLSRVAWCALAVGTAQAVVDYVVPYVNDRVAFGEPVSHRQGVAFTVADMATELEGMRLATYRAASRAEQGLDFSREAALARRLCKDHGMQIGSDGVQMLGGHGFVKEHPVERWYRDLRSIAVMEGVVLV